MKVSAENIRIFSVILRCWVGSFFRISLAHPSVYLGNILSEKETKKEVSKEEWKLIKKIVVGVKRLSPFIRKKRRCLVEALVVFNSIKKFGVSSNFMIGAKRDKDQLETHAWIEVNGKTIIGGPLTGYNELIRTR